MIRTFGPEGDILPLRLSGKTHMRKLTWISLICSVYAVAQDRLVNRHILGVTEPLTARSARAPSEIANDFLRGRAAELGLSGVDLGSAYIARQYTDAHNGVTHILYRQQFQGVDVYNSALVVNIDSDGRVLNAGGELFPAPTGALPEPVTALAAVRAAVKSVNPKAARRFVPFQSQKVPRRKGALRFTSGELTEDPEGRMVWFAARGTLVPAWQVFVAAEDGVTRYSVIADANQHVLARRAMTYFQSPPQPGTPRGMVFERESPQPNPTPGTLILTAPAFVERTMQSFAGDATASPKGWVNNSETAGNNASSARIVWGWSPLDTPHPSRPWLLPKPRMATSVSRCNWGRTHRTRCNSRTP